MENFPWLATVNGVALTLITGVLIFVLNGLWALKTEMRNFSDATWKFLESHKEETKKLFDKEAEVCKQLSTRADLLDRTVSAVADEEFSSKPYAEGKSDKIPGTSRIRKVLSEYHAT